MTTFIISLADSHFSDKRPRSRKDNFQETQYNKIQSVLDLAKSFTLDGCKDSASAIAIAGDIFHQPEGRLVSRKLDTKLLTLFYSSPCPIAVIAGNHDLSKASNNSIIDHPLGVLVSSRVVELVHWPDYIIVGDNPSVIITGKDYTIEGPKSWLDSLRWTGQLRELKKTYSRNGVEAQVLCMLHCFVGLKDSVFESEFVLGYNNLIQTGINVALIGHPHVNNGVNEIEDEDKKVISIVEPGALIRGTLAEKDINRKPSIAIAGFYSDGSHKIWIISIPHLPVSEVFDLENHDRLKKEKVKRDKFIKNLQDIEIINKSREEILEKVSNNIPMKILELTKHYINLAEAEEN